jgi:hypothetical protein
LDKDPETRLGSKGDYKEVIKHPYFVDINFEKLERKEYRSPYFPKKEVLTFKEDELKLGMKNRGIQLEQGKLVKKEGASAI